MSRSSSSSSSNSIDFLFLTVLLIQLKTTNAHTRIVFRNSTESK
jgi:hypothetical protein